MTAPGPTTVDRQLLQIYLTDHLAGATGAMQRLDRMRESSKGLPIHNEVVQLAEDIQADRGRLIALLDALDLGRRSHKEGLARLGELVGRLKLNGRLSTRSPLSPLLELELLRGGIIGKLSLWQTLGALAADLGLDSEEMAALERAAAEQLEVIARCHQTLAGDTFRS